MASILPVAAATTATLVSSQAPSIYGQPVTFTATVSANAPGSGTPFGTVTFLDGTKKLGTGTLDSTGKATLTTSSPGAGTHAITVNFAGDSESLGSTSATLTQTATNRTALITAAASTLVRSRSSSTGDCRWIDSAGTASWANPNRETLDLVFAALDYD